MKSSNMSKLLLILLSVAGMFFLGCGRSNKPPGLPKLYQCTLTFTQEGAPLANATVLLVNQEKDEWTVAGNTNESGVAKLVTHGKFSGAPAGQYKIVLRKDFIEGESSSDEYTSVKERKIYSLIELNYIKPDTTPLTVTLEKKSNNQKFDVGKSARILVDTIRPGT